MSHEDKLSFLKSNGLCINCLRPGHYIKGCRSLHKCKLCQKPHHTLLHAEEKNSSASAPPAGAVSGVNTQSSLSASTPISSYAAVGIRSDLLLMTCRVESSDGSRMEARALLDSGSFASFVSERLAQCLHLPHTSQYTRITGVAGLVRNSAQPVTNFLVSSMHNVRKKFPVTAVILSRVTSDLPLQPVTADRNWDHLTLSAIKARFQ